MVEVIKDACIACGICMQMNNEVFDYDADGKSKVIKQLINEDVKNIANLCPTGAIKVVEN